jgi:hypothetical protein
VTLTLVVSLLAASSAFAAIEGAWTGKMLERKPGHLNLNLMRGSSGNNMIGTTYRLEELSGLSSAQVHATSATPVRFELRAEAGALTLDGTFRDGKGAGHYSFAPNTGFFNAVRALGVDTELRDNHRGRRENSEEERLFVYALHDVSTAYIRSMQAEGFREPLEKYLEMRIFDITPEYVREMRSLGLGELDSSDLIGSKIHGVTPAYVRRARAAGWNVPLDKLQASAIHGATPEYAEELAKSGYANLSLDDLIAFRIHGVTPTFISELQELGYRNIRPKKLIEMRIFNVTPRFIRDLRDAGYSNVPVEKMIKMRISGLEPRMLKEMN